MEEGGGSREEPLTEINVINININRRNFMSIRDIITRNRST